MSAKNDAYKTVVEISTITACAVMAILNTGTTEFEKRPLWSTWKFSTDVVFYIACAKYIARSLPPGLEFVLPAAIFCHCYAQTKSKE
jgi:hypothetical protein